MRLGDWLLEARSQDATRESGVESVARALKSNKAKVLIVVHNPRS